MQSMLNYFFSGIRNLIIMFLMFPVWVNGNQDSNIEEQPRSDQSVDAFKRSYPRVTQRLNKLGLILGSPLYIRIFKDSKELEVWLESRRGTYELFKRYAICHHSGELGPKTREGDRQSPEGFYQVGRAQMNPWSNFHLAFNLGYPNAYDQAHQWTGGELMIHGRCSSSGCFAMTDYYMDEIYTLADAALVSSQDFFPVHIFPFRLSPENLAGFTKTRWYEFWLELAPGYRFFEENSVPPRVEVNEGGYLIEPASVPGLARREINGVPPASVYSFEPIQN